MVKHFPAVEMTPPKTRAYNCRAVTVEDLTTGTRSVDRADVVISARGSLNDINWPDVPGLEDMKIPVMHSAAWDEG